MNTLMRYAVPLALVLTAGTSGIARAELRIGSYTTQSSLTSDKHLGTIQPDLELIAGTTVTLTLNANSGRPYWVVALGAPGTKPQGYGLIQALINSTHVITIANDSARAGMGGGGVTWCADGMVLKLLASAGCLTGGTGTDAVVTVNFASGASDLKDANAPRYILFGHELIHALHATVGKRVKDNGKNEAQTIGNYLGMTAPVTNAALPTGITVNENLLRGENTYKDKNNSDAPTPLHCRNPSSTGEYPAPPTGQTHC
jgi:hypothetical protein